jgi:hypothetical protein
MTKSTRSAFLIGLTLGACIWLLSPVLTGRREPWDAAGALFGSGFLAGLLTPHHWISVCVGNFAVQVLVLLGQMAAAPANARIALWFALCTPRHDGESRGTAGASYGAPAGGGAGVNVLLSP